MLMTTVDALMLQPWQDFGSADWHVSALSEYRPFIFQHVKGMGWMAKADDLIQSVVPTILDDDVDMHHKYSLV